MTLPRHKVRSASLVFAGAVLALLSVFFVFYTARLLYVTGGLRSVRSNGHGAYIGAAVFPLLALAAGWGAWRCLRTLRDAPRGPA